MTDSEFSDLLQQRYELPNVEFKPPGPRSNKDLFARLVRAVLAMANRRDGGVVVVGVEDDNKVLSPLGMSDAEVSTWNYDDVSHGISEYADPFVEFDFDVKEHNGRKYVVLEVHEFQEIPVLCRKQYEPHLRPGVCYVRSRRRPESVGIPGQTEMRELLDVAIQKGVRKWVTQATLSGILARPSAVVTQPSDEELYRRQRGELL